jgi:hypothetical protein
VGDRQIKEYEVQASRTSPTGDQARTPQTVRGRLIRLACTTVCSLAVLGGGAAAASAACTDTWTGGGNDGEWGTPANWSMAAPPDENPSQYDNNVSTLNCDVVLPSSTSAYTVDLPQWSYNQGLTAGPTPVSTTQIDDLTIGSGAKLVVHGESYDPFGDLMDTIELDVTGGTIEPGGTLELLTSDDGAAPDGASGDHGGIAILGGSGTLTNDGSFTSVTTSTQATATNTFHNELHETLVNAAGASAELQSGYLDISTGVTVTNNGTWTTDPGTAMTVTHNPLQTGPSTFANNGTYANNGATQIVGNNQPDVFAENGPETGNPVQISNQGELQDATGTGSFLIDNQNGTLAGTIPAGQTVTAEGDLFSPGNFLLTLTLAGSQVVNDGTLDFNVPNASPDLYTDVRVSGAPLVNQGTINFTDAAPKLITEFDDNLTNQPGAAIDVASGTTWFSGGGTYVNNGTLTVAPGANLDINANPFLTGPTTFTNGGAIVPQIAAGATGTVTLDHNTNINLGGTVSPQLINGYAPAVGTEVQAFPVNGATITGTFGAVTGNWFPDYYHQTGDTPNYIGLEYGQAPTPPTTSTTGGGGATTTGGGGGGGSAATRAPSIGKPTAKGSVLSVKLSCAKGKACKAATVTETVTEKVKGKKKTVVVGKATVKLAAGRSTTASVKLNRTGKALLAKTRHLKVSVKVTVGGKTKRSAKLTLSSKGKGHKKAKR